MLSEEMRRLLDFLMENGLEKQEIMDVYGMVDSDERAIMVLNRLMEYKEMGKTVTKEAALIAAII